MKDYHALLQVARNVTRPEIQAAYRRLAKKYHPDVNKSADAHEKFCEITEAYEFLINHWQQPQADAVTGPRDPGYAPFRHSEDYEQFRHEVRERAQQHAKMRYEKFRKQHEAFQVSGINDLGLLFTIALRVFGLLLFLFLLFLPVGVAVVNGWVMIFIGILTWPFAAIIGWYIHDNRKHYLMPGTFYYSPVRIRELFSRVHPTDMSCYYCRTRLADSMPYKVELLKLKDLKLKSGGFMQHHVNYINQNACVLVPRSRKAFILHAAGALTRVTFLLACLVFLPVSSMVWRFIAGIATGTMASSLLLAIGRTRSNVSYLVSPGLLFRVGLWILAIVLVSGFSVHPFNIRTSDSIQFVLVSIVIFDCLVMLVLDLLPGRFVSRPLIRQYPDVARKMESGFRVYNDIPVISVIYPLFKWIFG